MDCILDDCRVLMSPPLRVKISLWLCSRMSLILENKCWGISGWCIKDTDMHLYAKIHICKVAYIKISVTNGWVNLNNIYMAVHCIFSFIFSKVNRRLEWPFKIAPSWAEETRPLCPSTHTISPPPRKSLGMGRPLSNRCNPGRRFLNLFCLQHSQQSG